MDDRPGSALLAGLDAIASYGIVAVDAFGTILSWNAGAAALTRIPTAAARGRTLNALLATSPDDLTPTFLQELSESDRDLGLWLRRAGGGRFWSRSSAAPTLEPDGSPVGFVFIFRDSTALRTAREELERSRTMFEGILAIASDAVVSVDETQRIIFFNQGAERIFGYTQEEALGRPLDMLIPDQFRPHHPDRVREFGRSEVTARVMGERGEISGLRSNGEEFPAEASISKLEIGGSIIYTAVLRDVTERRLAQEAVAKQAEELARSNADLERFAYVASHDLQEPLRMVTSYTQLLARRYKGRLDEDADEFIGFAIDGVTRMQALIDDLLAYSRLERRGGEFRSVALDSTLRSVLDSLSTLIADADATVTRDPLPDVWGDPTQLSQLFQNLIQNALKFRRPGARSRVHVGVADTGAEWQFCVRDNGIGIPDEFQERIFIIFQRLHGRTEYPGTGIGLALCKKIVERHQGRIWVESQADEGSTFYFTLPKDDHEV